MQHSLSSVTLLSLFSQVLNWDLLRLVEQKGETSFEIGERIFKKW